MATVTERVQAGAAWLDQHRPGWLDRIDLITLNVEDPECCVLGQEFGDYGDRPDALRDYREAERLGFYVRWAGHGDDRYTAEYAALTEAWKDYVLTEGPRRVAVCPECPKSEAEITDD